MGDHSKLLKHERSWYQAAGSFGELRCRPTCKSVASKVLNPTCCCCRCCCLFWLAASASSCASGDPKISSRLFKVLFSRVHGAAARRVWCRHGCCCPRPAAGGGDTLRKLRSSTSYCGRIWNCKIDIFQVRMRATKGSWSWAGLDETLGCHERL